MLQDNILFAGASVRHSAPEIVQAVAVKRLMLTHMEDAGQCNGEPLSGRTATYCKTLTCTRTCMHTYIHLSARAHTHTCTRKKKNMLASRPLSTTRIHKRKNCCGLFHIQTKYCSHARARACTHAHTLTQRKSAVKSSTYNTHTRHAHTDTPPHTHT